jgi:hypothetical protein
MVRSFPAKWQAVIDAAAVILAQLAADFVAGSEYNADNLCEGG